MRILVKYPSRERPAQFLRVLKQWVGLAHDLKNIHWLFSFDTDDDSMLAMETEITKLGLNKTVRWGQRGTKISAINRDINELAVPWDILLVISDDMEPLEQAWDWHVRAQMEGAFPDLDGLLWFPDGYQKDIVTLPCIGRRRYEMTRYVYHPSYISVFADNEQTDVAFRDQRIVYVMTRLVRHAHPANDGNVAPDALHKHNETQAIWDRDEATYKRRKAQGFPA